MSIATDLQTIAENTPLVYAAGKQKQYDEFWDEFQNHGNRKNYQFAFAGNGFNDTIFKPKYPITITQNNYGDLMFYVNTLVKTIDIPLSFTSLNSSVFRYALSLETITSLTVTENISLSDWFYNCESLKNLTMHGVIGNSLNLKYSTLLTVASAKSVLSCLSSLGSGKTLMFASVIQNAVEADAEAVSLISNATSNGWTVAFA